MELAWTRNTEAARYHLQVARDAAQALADKLRADKSLFRTVTRPDGIPFFRTVGGDIPLHLAEVHAYATGMLDVRYEIGTARAP